MKRLMNALLLSALAGMALMTSCSKSEDPWKEIENVLERIVPPAFPDKNYTITDYWNGSDSRYMREMQMDFTSEVMPGTLLQYERGAQDGAKLVRGVKPDGKIAFTARCVYD